MKRLLHIIIVIITCLPLAAQSTGTWQLSEYIRRIQQFSKDNP